MRTALGPECIIGVLGAGAMGTGIAQVAADQGHTVRVLDARADAIAKARAELRRQLDRDVAKNRRTAPDAQALLRRITWFAGTDPAPFADAGLVIEAIIEDLEAKRTALAAVAAHVDRGAVLATNTSSLSVTALSAAVPVPERVLGLHFFNPVPRMPLVEIIPGHRTAPGVAAACGALIRRWGKTTVQASDTPGFIVNRVARPFYGEALRLHEEGIASPATVDHAMREVGGFRMGPFELMDLIGNDVNLAVTRTVFEALGFDPRYRPSLAQQRLVDAGLLGRKTGHGWYRYGPDAPPRNRTSIRTWPGPWWTGSWRC